ncbi:MAG: 5'/3'-nucleotidase SurE [Pseudomonadales bacterium]|jgi:5'-nucleotidase|nr:5'/3'-nucleotidase SurE [Pseudomonadales bacterium]
MRVLITNDDGVESPGIHELARQIEAAGYDVIVMAPDHDASGTGASLGGIGNGIPVNVTPTRIEGLASPAYGIAGPPAMCVVAGILEALGPMPDVVVSGINAGLNTGRSALHSGTIGAALAGQNFGIRSLAVSMNRKSPDHEWLWSTAAAITVEVLPTLIAGPKRGVLNLNVPGVPRDEVLGIRWAGLAKLGSVQSAIEKFEDGKIHFQLVDSGYEPHETTDLGTVHAGYAALTSIHGASEVWGPEGEPGKLYHPDDDMHAASAGHELRPSRSVFDD